jgi:hypothetical protein
MTLARIYVSLFNSGAKQQSRELAESMSIWLSRDNQTSTTVYGFKDCSMITACGLEFYPSFDGSRNTTPNV